MAAEMTIKVGSSNVRTAQNGKSVKLNKEK